MRHNAHPRALCAPVLAGPRRHVPVSAAQRLLLRHHDRAALHLLASAPRLAPPSAPRAAKSAAAAAVAPRYARTGDAPATPSPPSPPPPPPSTSSSSSRQDQQARAAALSLNPPATTRPPPLGLPPRPDTPSFSHFLAMAKAYINFYKVGLRYVYTNTRQLWAAYKQNNASSSPTDGAVASRAALSRADMLMRIRWRHDASRVPLFVVMLIVCGEITPVVVLFVPRVAPYTCRLPAQVEKIREGEEERRRSSLYGLRARAGALAGEAVDLPYGVVAGHLARSLGVVSPLWDHLRWVPGFLAGACVGARLRFLAKDDALLVATDSGDGAGGVGALEAEELELACVDRGIDTMGREEGELRTALERWLELTGATAGAADEERTRRMAALLMGEEADWPETWPGEGESAVDES